MEMHQIRYFLAVCQTRNFTKAADLCNVTQPALTRAIQKLEEELGGALFHRDHKSTRLTSLGQSMQPLLDQTYASAQAARLQADHFRRAASGRLSLGLAQTMSPELLTAPLAEINRKHQGLQVSVDQMPLPALLESLEEGDLDVAVIAAPDELPEKLHAWTLYREAHCLVAPQGNPIAAKEDVKIGDLDNATWIDRPYCRFAQQFLETCRSQGIRLDCRHRATSDDQVQQMVRAGLGLSLLPSHHSSVPGLAFLRIPHFEPVRTVLVASRAGRPLGSASLAFLRLVRAVDWTSLVGQAAAGEANDAPARP